jgi:hypothetical protein
VSTKDPSGEASAPITEEGIELVHPVYLDVPMMVNFLASAGGDVTFKQEETVTKKATQSRDAAGHLNLAGVAGLLGLGVSGASHRGHEVTEETRLERQYTAASLFSILRSRLQFDLGAIRLLDGPDDLEGLPPGTLVEMSGAVTSDPVQRAMTAVTELVKLASDILSIQPVGHLVEQFFASRDDTRPLAAAMGWTGMVTPPPNVTRPGAGKHTQPRAPLKAQQGDRVNADELAAQIAGFIARVTESAVNGAVTDYTIETSDGGLHGVLTMSTEFLPAEAALMLGSQMTVLGKVTAVLDAGDTIDLLRRSTLGYFPQERVQQVLDGLDTSLRLSLPKVTVSGPGVQILPLAVFV